MNELLARLRTASVICGCFVLLLQGGQAVAQSASANVAMAEGDAQRSRVFATQSLDAAPTRLLWRAEKLFKITPTEHISSQSGPIRFSFDLPTGQHYTVPIVCDGILFFTVYLQSGYFYAIDAATGKQLVILKFDNNQLSATAAVGHTAFFGTRTGRVYAYDIDRKQTNWIFESDKSASFSYASPVIDEGIVYLVGNPGFVVALGADDGKLKWTFKSDRDLGGPVIKNDNLIVYAQNGLLVSLDKKTGAKKWVSEIGRKFTAPRIIDDQIIVRHVDGEVRAYALADGALRWKSKKDDGANSGLVLFKNSVIYSERYGNLTAIDARTGLPKWKFKTKRPCAVPSVAGSTLYAVCDDKNIYALDAETGQLRWDMAVKKVGPPPIVADGVMYFLDINGMLQAIN